MTATKMNGYAEHTNGVSKHVSTNGHAFHDEENSFKYDTLITITDYLLDRTSIRPKIGIICGSGLGALADTLSDSKAFPYDNIPQFPVSTVPGHKGQLVFGRLNGVELICMQGRFHYYEGYPLWKCCMPVRVMKLIGVTHLIVTNAAGGINEKFNVGDIMIMRDHVNFLGFAGNCPLVGPNDERFGPRFPAMSRAYDATLIKKAKAIAKDMGIEDIIQEGVYTCLGGPCYETIAEVRFMKAAGIDAVGMSTVHEVLVARHCGMTVFALSLITNKCIMDYETECEANHEEVISTGQEKAKILQDLVSRMVSVINE